eukprot:COSAG01_NODE_3444_length_6087_cov_8.153140_3_plen_118_part_00
MRSNDAALSPPLVLLRAALQKVSPSFLGLIATLRSNDGFGGGNEIVNNLIFNYCRESSVRMSHQKRTPACPPDLSRSHHRMPDEFVWSFLQDHGPLCVHTRCQISYHVGADVPVLFY